MSQVLHFKADKLETSLGWEDGRMGSITEQYSEGEESHLDGKMEPVNLSCLLVPGARLILFTNALGDLECQSRLQMATSESL